MRRNSYRQRQRKFWAFVISLLVLSVSIALLPAGELNGELKTVMIWVAGSLFWIGLAATVIMAVNINHSRRASPVFRSLYPGLRQFGPINFFRNRPATVADVMMILSLIGSVAALLYANSNYIKLGTIAVFVFSFGMHCMLNGVNYIYLKYKTRREILS